MSQNSEFSLSALSGALAAAGLSAFLSEPVYINGPSVARAYMTGRIRIHLGGSPAPAPQQAAPGGGQALHRNDLQLIDLGSGQLVAVQPVTGIIMPGASPAEEEYYWMFNLDRLHHAVAFVSATPAVKSLILRMDTPGGSVMGLNGAAQALQSLAQRRPDMAAVAYVQHDCCSAGMYLAAALQQIHAAPGARVGSIGTIASLSDSTGFWQKLGFETRYYTADSKLKAMGRGTITEEHDAYMQDLVGQYSKEFKSWMAERRGLAAADMHGQAWEARLAPAGMVDSAVCCTFEEFLAAGLL